MFSKESVWNFWSRHKMLVILGIAGLIAFTLPLVMNPYCSIPHGLRNELPYWITEDSKQTIQNSESGPYAPFSHFTFGPEINSTNRTIERTHTEYEAPEQEKPWINGFICDINGADYVLAWFTVFLAISTFYLWRETERLAKGAEEQSRYLTRIERPYCVPDNFRIEIPNIALVRKMNDADQRATSVGFTVRYDVLNSGTRTALCYVGAIRPDVTRLPRNPLPAAQTPFDGLVPVSPGQSVPGVVVNLALRGNEAIAIIDGHATLFVSGFIGYWDVHRTNRRTGFLYRYSATAPAGVTSSGPASYWYDSEEGES